MTHSDSFNVGSVRTKLALAVQLVLLVGLGAGASHRLTRMHDRREHPPLREQPLTITPLYDYEDVVSDEQLRQVLRKMVPRDRGKQNSINSVDHALRFWGKEAKFANRRLLSGEDMRSLLLDHERFTEVFSPNEKPLLVEQPEGVRVRVQEGSKSSSHFDHTVASLAEVGTPLSFPVRTPNRETTFDAMVRQAMRDFTLNHVECEWTALIFALFVEGRSWTTTEGQRIDFDRLANRLMRETLTRGSCGGMHRLMGLVVLLRVNETDPDHPILSAPCRQRILEYLKSVTGRLVRNQHPDGFWNGYWPDEAPTSREPTEDELDALNMRLIITGHTLEWWALAPAELHPPRHVITSAGQWMATTIIDFTDQEIRDYFIFLTHAGNALSLWRGRLPAEVDLEPTSSADIASP